LVKIFMVDFNFFHKSQVKSGDSYSWQSNEPKSS
jgi:hypothetical protein